MITGDGSRIEPRPGGNMSFRLTRTLLIIFCLNLYLIILGTDFAYAETINLISANKIIDDFKKKINDNPDDVENRIELGVFYFQLQEYPLVKQYFEEAIIIDKDNAIARYNLGKTLIVLGEKDKGIAECEQALNLGLDDINVYKTLSVEYFNKRDLEN